MKTQKIFRFDDKVLATFARIHCTEQLSTENATIALIVQKYESMQREIGALRFELESTKNRLHQAQTVINAHSHFVELIAKFQATCKQDKGI